MNITCMLKYKTFNAADANVSRHKKARAIQKFLDFQSTFLLKLSFACQTFCLADLCKMESICSSCVKESSSQQTSYRNELRSAIQSTILHNSLESVG